MPHVLGGVLQLHGLPGFEFALQSKSLGTGLQVVARDISMATVGQWENAVQHALRPLDDCTPAYWVVGASSLLTAIFRNSVRAVQRIVQTAPPRVGSVERIARIVHGDGLTAVPPGARFPDPRGLC